VRRLVDAAALPDLLAREAAAAILEVAGADAVVIFIRGKDEPRISARGRRPATAAALVKAALAGTAVGGMRLITEPLGGDKDGPRVALVAPRARSATLENAGCGWWAPWPDRDSSWPRRGSGRHAWPTRPRSSARSSRLSRALCAPARRWGGWSIRSKRLQGNQLTGAS